MKRTGFTLIELLIVIAIIGVLATLLFANFSGVRERSRDTKRKSDLQAMRTALQLYMNDFNTFPGAVGGKIAGCGSNGTSTCEWESPFSAGNPTSVYMGQLPVDPLNTGEYVYTYDTSTTVDYTITVQLENISDPDSPKSQTRCGVASDAIEAGRYMVCNQ